MSDIVERLRDSDTTRRIGESYADVHDRRQADRDEAADEITRLRAENERLSAYAKRAAMDVLLCKDGNILLHEKNEKLRAALKKAKDGLDAGVKHYAERDMYGNVIPGDEQYPWVKAMQIGLDASSAALEGK